MLGFSSLITRCGDSLPFQKLNIAKWMHFQTAAPSVGGPLWSLSYVLHLVRDGTNTVLQETELNMNNSSKHVLLNFAYYLELLQTAFNSFSQGDVGIQRQAGCYMYY